MSDYGYELLQQTGTILGVPPGQSILDEAERIVGERDRYRAALIRIARHGPWDYGGCGPQCAAALSKVAGEAVAGKED